MAQHLLDLRPRIDREKLHRVEQALDLLGPMDTLVLIFEREDSHETQPVVKMLHERGLGWQPKGEHHDSYAIYVGRHLTRPTGPEDRR